MSTLPLSRRHVLLGAVASATLAAMQQAIAQTASGGDDWLEMVKAHHKMVEQHFDTMLDSAGKTFLKREVMERKLDYLLTAHSVAEENVLYPALARAGLINEADRLYLDQAHAKVMNAGLQLVAAKEEGEWFQKVRDLRAAVLKHAKEDEEANLYPKLQAMLDKGANARLAQMYRREFGMVRPDRKLP